MIGSTNSMVNAGKGKRIYASNNSGKVLAIGDKVMVNFGLTSEQTPVDFSYTVDKGRVCPLVFFDDFEFLESYGLNTYFYRYQDLNWTRTFVQKTYKSSFAKNKLIRYHADGIISGVAINKGDVGETGFIVDKNMCRNLPATYFYLGQYNNINYCIKTATNDIYAYDIVTNTVGDFKLSGTGVTENAVLYGNHGLMVNTSGLVEFFEIDSQGNFLITSTCVMGANFNLLFATGVGAGHYLFVTNSIMRDYHESTVSDTNNLLFIYQIDENQTLKKVSVECLMPFETINCVINYDERNQILGVGTKDQVYFYQFNESDKSITPLDINLDVPSNEFYFCYWPYISPNKKTVVLLHQSSVDDLHVYCYILGNTRYQIVNNSAINYLPDNSFTGFVTKLGDEDGKYEVEVCLPDEVEVSINTNITADSVEFLGGGK